MHLKAASKQLDRFIVHCKKSGLKITPQRCSVYKHLLRSKSHPTAEETYQVVKKEYPNISYDTVNRTLLTLAEIGLADIVQTKGGGRRFDLASDEHHHFQCLECGKIIDFSDRHYDDLKVPESIRKRHTVFTKRVVLSGLCRECRNSKGATAKIHNAFKLKGDKK